MSTTTQQEPPSKEFPPQATENGSSSTESTKSSSIENFKNVITDMLRDFTNTFPEYAFMWSKWTGENLTDEVVDYLYKYCCNIYPEYFFDILYSNEDIFAIHYEKSTCFLPFLDFKSLYNCDGITEKTKKTIWNYLQLILMIIIQSIDSKDNFGNLTQHLFSGVKEDDLYSKIKETIENLSNFFEDIPVSSSSNPEDDSEFKEYTSNQRETDRKGEEEEEEEEGSSSFFSNKKMPDIKGIYEHLSTLFNGKIGGLAKEMAEEISKDMNDILGTEEGGEGNAEPLKSSKDVIQQLLKNPEKMTNIIKSVNEKLQSKIKSGEISQAELVKEASDILGKMKDMGDMKDFKQMFKSFSKMSGMGGGAGCGKNMQFDFNALENMNKKNTLREKMKKKLLDKQLAAAAASAATATASPQIPIVASKSEKEKKSQNIIPTEDPHHFKFVVEGEEQIEKTPVSSSNTTSTNAKKNKKKKKTA